ncbi:MAG: hypothetical protein OEZ65_05140 [Gemmatimonadota bacterium]|nr:hypothetical protein [Gemmatimonadota bacterium]MDH5758953.1 hypothetical protein [Gemmatimonadota bacterium]
MILPMSRIRILAPVGILPEVLERLQDFGRLHLASPAESADVLLMEPDRAQERHLRQLSRISDTLRSTLDRLERDPSLRLPAPTLPERAVLARRLRRARRVGRDVAREAERRRSLEEERALLARYRLYFSSFQALAEAATQWPDAAAYHVILPRERQRPVSLLREGLTKLLGDEFEMWTQELETGESAHLILVSRASDTRLEELFREARVEEIQLPGVERGLTPVQAIPRVVERLEAIPGALAEVATRMESLRASSRAALQETEIAVNDELERAGARGSVGLTDHAFVLEGWLPAGLLHDLERSLGERFGDLAVLEEVSRAEWAGEEVPVTLHNPRLFRPFELLVGILPLPTYGSIDPTPFLAVFFPMFFGVVLGDVGYGGVLAGAALLLRRNAVEGGVRQSVAEIAGACAAFTIIFGFLYGELFGDAGALLFGMRALALHREEALLPFLGLALAIGVVHTLLGLVLNLVTRLREGRRAALGPGVTLFMVVMVILAILAAVDVLPGAFFTPAVIMILVLFPVLVVVEGILGPTELVTTLGHILSYARVMAVGTASVMMAAAANRMVGTLGSVVVGSLFALLFHLVNFALGVFSPALHALRLHYVEFFGTFYSPGGTRYEPFGHWMPETHSPSREDA